MGRPAFFASLTLTCLATAWWGCTASNPSTTDASSTTTTTTTSGSGGSGGTGGMDIHVDGGDDSGDEDSACVSTSAAAQHIHLDIVFLIDQSGSMTGPKWIGTTKALTTFWNDPASIGIGAGIVYMPTKIPYDCDPTHYEALTVPIDVLPTHAFALSNSLPADATGVGTPTYGALEGALMAATAFQDAHPTHKVIVVFATDGDPNGCGTLTIDQIAALSKSALDYNGVQTYVIGVQGSTLSNLDKIAAAGGTTQAYDVTSDISLWSQKMTDIRNVALGCQFDLPPPPNGQQLDPNKVNFSYTPKGIGMSSVLPRANDLADCNSKPGWYYDDNNAPTKIVLCPASCTVVEADPNAKVNVLFGCKTLIN